MPTKHIDNDSWSSIEALTIKAIQLSGKLVKETDMIRLLVKKGAESITDDELRNINGFIPKYGVLSWQRDGVIRSHGTVHPEHYAQYFADHKPFMTYVYGMTATGKTNFKDRFLAILAEQKATSLKVIDSDDISVTDELRKHLFEQSFKKNESTILIEHGHDVPQVMTRFVASMALCDVNFVFSDKAS